MIVGPAIQLLLDGHHLSRADARELMGSIMDGEATEAQIAGFLVALRTKGETADEIAGFAEAMREHVVPVTPQRSPVVDIVGTGGDGAHTFNISTAAALVAAAAGAAVAKHGNRAASSQAGSADVLEELGIALEQEPERIALSIDDLGFGFMFARAHHPAMRFVAPVRQQIGIRTVFNVLGPLANPAGACDGVFGVYSPALVPLFAEALAELGARRAFVVHGESGLDELSPSGPSLVAEIVDGEVSEWELDPRDLGIEPSDPAELRGGSATENAVIVRAVLAGEPGGRRDAVLLNASGALVAAGLADDLVEGVALGAETIDSGAAASRLDALVAFSAEGVV
jgi:anthranilate phosphoribosyltransferase